MDIITKKYDEQDFGNLPEGDQTTILAEISRGHALPRPENTIYIGMGNSLVYAIVYKTGVIYDALKRPGYYGF